MEKKMYLFTLLFLVCLCRVSAQNDNHYENYERAYLTEEDKARVEQKEAMFHTFVLPPARHGGPLYVTYSKFDRAKGNNSVIIGACDSLKDGNGGDFNPLIFKIIDEKNDTTTLVCGKHRWGGLTFRKIKDGGEKFTVIVSSPNYKTRVFKEVLLEDNFAMSVRLIPKDYDPTAEKNQE